MQRTLGAIALCIALALGGCKTTNETIGAGLGGVIGGAIGSQFGSGTGRYIATAAGAAAGALVGYGIARYLTPEEKKEASTASEKALDRPTYDRRGQEKAVTWKSPTNPNTKGTTKVVERATNDGRECVVKRDTAYVEGREVVDQSRVCRTADGGWEKVVA